MADFKQSTLNDGESEGNLHLLCFTISIYESSESGYSYLQTVSYQALKYAWKKILKLIARFFHFLLDNPNLTFERLDALKSL